MYATSGMLDSHFHQMERSFTRTDLCDSSHYFDQVGRLKTNGAISGVKWRHNNVLQVSETKRIINEN